MLPVGDALLRPVSTAVTSAVTSPEEMLEQHRVELTGYCYRMLGSAFDADDAVQETLVRAWQGFERFEGRSSVRAWLYRIATNVCLDVMRGRQRRALPVDLTPASTAGTTRGPALPEATWVRPIPDSLALSAGADPAELATGRDSIRLAFVAALQHLPPRQRAVLILRDVLRFRADEVADLLDSTLASVNGSLRRARVTLATAAPAAPVPAPAPVDPALLARYVDAFERDDIEALVALLHDEATLSMPPFALWLQGIEDISRWLARPDSPCAGSRLVPVEANGSPAFAHYHRTPDGHGYEAFAIQILTLADNRVTAFDFFLDPTLFPLFGLPTTQPKPPPPDSVQRVKKGTRRRGRGPGSSAP
jgi:RNA polymerase sigma-70 factor (ECF subfamily)